MAKYRIVSKGNIVTIKSKLSFGEQINEREINIFEKRRLSTQHQMWYLLYHI